MPYGGAWYHCRVQEIHRARCNRPVVLEALDDARVVADHRVHRVALVAAHVLRAGGAHALSQQVARQPRPSLVSNLLQLGWRHRSCM